VLDEEPAAWLDVLLHDVPALRRAGWQVEVAASFPVQLAELDGDITAEIRESTGTDWFELHLGAVVDGERVDLVPALLGLIVSGNAAKLLQEVEDDQALPLLLPLPDGRLLTLPIARVRPVLATLLELHAGGAAAEGRVRLQGRDAALLAELDAASAAAGLVWQGGEALRGLGRALREHSGIPPVAVPASFATELRLYQQRGVDWMAFLGAAGLGGVLADDMGLGKTVQALAHLTAEHAAGRLDRPALVVCPTSLVPNWSAEAARFAPGLRVLALHGPDRRSRFGDIAVHDLIITTYPLLFRDAETLIAPDWSVVLLDEAHGIKNPVARTAGLARKLRARQRIALTGTPLENHLGELWSLFDWVLPGFLGTRQTFGQTWRTPIERAGDTTRRDLLARRVRPFLLRRTKAEVAAELPPRTEIRQPVELGDGQRAVYEGIRLAMHGKVARAIAERGLARSGIIVLDALLKMRQACCDPRLLKLSTTKAVKASSAKLDRLMEMLPALVEDGRRVLVFSQFTSMLALIARALDEAGLAYVQLTGQTQDRDTPVRRFQAGEVPLFLISLKAGGVGLNLTAADTVVHYDPWWNPAVEDQATDRAHRIGQDKPVFVHRLVALGTVEERMEDLKARKRALVAGILDNGAGNTLALTEADVEALFAPG
jgi:SNF2 family DNA or RNA helicase